MQTQTQTQTCIILHPCHLQPSSLPSSTFINNEKMNLNEFLQTCSSRDCFFRGFRRMPAYRTWLGVLKRAREVRLCQRPGPRTSPCRPQNIAALTPEHNLLPDPRIAFLTSEHHIPDPQDIAVLTPEHRFHCPRTSPPDPRTPPSRFQNIAFLIPEHHILDLFVYGFGVKQPLCTLLWLLVQLC